MPSSDRPCADRSAISRSRAMSFAEYSRLRPPTRVGRHQSEPVVLAQRLRVQSGQLRGDGDRVDGRVVGDAKPVRGTPSRS